MGEGSETFHTSHNVFDRAVFPAVIAKSPSPRRIMLVGLLNSLQDLHPLVLQQVGKWCSLYATGKQSSERSSFIDIHILYGKEEGVKNATAISSVESVLAQCRQVTILHQNTLFEQQKQKQPWKGRENYSLHDFSKMNRYQRLAMLRSLQRASILGDLEQQHQSSYQKYEVVVNIDWDILELPPLSALVQAADTVAATVDKKTAHTAVVCSNGYEEWSFPAGITLLLYYDTFASVDQSGTWYYHEYVQKWWNTVTLQQAVLFRKILHRTDGFWPMQTCFGGLAVYDFVTWANTLCDYDQARIKLQVQSLNSVEKNDGESGHRGNTTTLPSQWTLSKRYTIDHTLNGDSCEHVVFQQCLRQAAAASAGSPSLHQMIGIQPNLWIGRQANTETIQMVTEITIIIVCLLAITSGFIGRRYGRPHGKKQI